MNTTAGYKCTPCEIRKYSSHHHAFLTRRFDRIGNQHVHFSSAMTQLQYYDGQD